MLKYLRIAVTPLSLTACVLLIALWVRSYWRFDFYYPPAINARVTSGLGVVGIQAMDAHEKSVLQSIATIQSLSVAELVRHGTIETQNLRDLFLFRVSRSQLFVPIWFLILAAFIFAAAPWVSKWNIRLRTLLIATALVAVGLGFIIWAVR